MKIFETEPNAITLEPKDQGEDVSAHNHGNLVLKSSEKCPNETASCSSTQSPGTLATPPSTKASPASSHHPRSSFELDVTSTPDVLQACSLPRDVPTRLLSEETGLFPNYCSSASTCLINVLGKHQSALLHVDEENHTPVSSGESKTAATHVIAHGSSSNRCARESDVDKRSPIEERDGSISIPPECTFATVNSEKINYARWYLTCVNNLHDKLAPAQTMFTRAIACYQQFGFSQVDILTHIVYASCYMSSWDDRENSRSVTLRRRCLSFICFLYLAQVYLQDKCISLKRWQAEIHPSENLKSINKEIFLLQKEREFILRVPQNEFEAQLKKFDFR